jgi:hypothetical protein
MSLHRSYFFNNRYEQDARGRLWSNALMNPVNFRVAQKGDDDFVKPILLAKEHAIRARSAGEKDTDISFEIIDFLVETALFHRKIDQPGKKDMLITLLKSYDTYIRYALDLKTVAASDASVAVDMDAAGYPAKVQLGLTTAALDGHVADSHKQANVIFVLIAELLLLRAQRDAKVAGVTENDFVRQMENRKAQAFKALINMGRAVNTKMEPLLELIKDDRKTVKIDANDIDPDALMRDIMQAILNVAFSPQLVAPKFDKGVLDVITAAHMLPFVDAINQGFYKWASNVYKSVGVHGSTLGDVPEAANLQRLIAENCTKPPTQTGKACSFAENFLSLRKVNGEEVPLTTHIPKSELQNYRLNLLKVPGHNITFFAASQPTLPTTATGFVYRNSAGKFERQPIDPVKDATLLQDIYTAVYRSATGTKLAEFTPKTTTTRIDISTDLSHYAIATTSTGQSVLPIVFSVKIGEITQSIYTESEKIRMKMSRPAVGSSIGAIGENENNAIFRDLSGKWKVLSADGKTAVDYSWRDNEAKAINEGGSCAAAALNGSPEQCQYWITSVLSSNDPDDISKFINALGNNKTFFATAKLSIKSIKPQIKYRTVAAFGFGLVETTRRKMGKPVMAIEGVDQWLVRIGSSDLTKAVKNNPNLKTYLQELVVSLNETPGIANPGMYGPDEKKSASVSNDLGIPIFPQVNPYSVPANGLWGVASLATTRSAFNAPTVHGAYLIGAAPAMPALVQSGGSARFDEFQNNWKHGLEGAKLEDTLFKEALAAFKTTNKVINPDEIEDTKSKIKDMLEKEQVVVSRISAINFAKKAFATLGDYAPEVFQMMDLEDMQRKYKEDYKEYLATRTNVFKTLAGWQSAAQSPVGSIIGETAPQRELMANAVGSVRKINFNLP